MTANAQTPSRPGLKEGKTSEFTLFFNVKPGHAQQIRDYFQGIDHQKMRVLADRIGTLHDLRWVLFDDDTRLLFASNFDGDWDAYIDDFGALIPDVFDAILQHTEDYPGIKDPSLKDFVIAHQATACNYLRAAPDATITDIQKALRVNKAFQQLLDAAN
ncbi:hypothetical protein [Streptomyces sp. NBC_00154]|uniref:hypothetical protein n=1 Tax=Streptomyces sp. NBC_00154 TaxID=2975670 RepID=UPI00225A240A|nr:hypothetical protein [Streptomyces sp. NBC_00154]MCX5316992.1 hypothetical protein [Streptomyces sp. NBC_00154]